MSERILHVPVFPIGMLTATTALHQLDEMPFRGMLQKKVPISAIT
ncbi:MAG: hypothetical protein ACI8UD_002148 [Planctomycetota bacterium]|jgi:hypothetical protein